MKNLELKRVHKVHKVYKVHKVSRPWRALFSRQPELPVSLVRRTPVTL